MSVNIPNGYKQTKVGVTPNDWEEFQLKDILNLTLEPLNMEDEKEYELITVRRRFSGVDSRGIFKGKEILVKNQFYVRENDFVISKRQISHGACGLVPKGLDGAIVSNEYNVFQPNKDLLNQSFFNYYVRLPKFSQTFYNYSDGIHIEKLLFKTQSWLKQKIPFPPLKEQQKISQILITWDDAISKQETFIKAKEELKKGLMQKLLSGEVRFDGFDREWEEVRLGNVLVIGSGKDYKHLESGDIPVFGTGGYMLSVNDYLYDGESVCIGRKGTINKPMFLTGKFWTVDTLFYTHSYKNSIPKFLYFAFLQINWKKYNEASGVPSLSKTTIENIKIKLPLKAEQQKIAQVLTLADKEIELLKNELEALKEQKRGLMQRLLTGEVRV